MKFFTDHTVINDYLLIKIGDYLKGDFTKYKEVFIDPGVYELTKTPEYSWMKPTSKFSIMYRNIGNFLDTLPENHYFSADYPCDMNEAYTDEFLHKSWINAELYCNHKQYIVTIQSKFNDYWSFREWFDRYNELPIASGILGLGNFCRIFHTTEFVVHALPYIFRYCNHPRIHIYGLALRLIPYAYRLAKKYGVELSMDSTKWTRNCKTSGLPSCRKENRQEYFDLYITTLKERGIALE